MGLFEDILEFAKQPARAYQMLGRGSKPSDRAETMADIKLNKLGSIMGSQKALPREEEMANLKSQGPLLSTIISLVKEGLDPLNAGKPGEAMISPSAWKGIAPDAQAMLKRVFDKAPDLLKKVQSTPSELLNFVLAPHQIPSPGAMGTLERINPILDRLSVAEPYAGDLSTVAHELQHHINTSRIREGDPADLGTIGMLIRDVLKEKMLPTGSITNRMGELQNVTSPGIDLSQNILAATTPEQKAALTTLTMPKPFKKSNALIQSPYKLEPSGTKFGQEEWGDFLKRAIGDEGLAYLGESTINPKTPQSILDLAKKLNVGTQVPQQSLMDDVMESLNQLRKNSPSLGGGEY